MIKTTINPATVETLRNRVQQGIDSRWMNGITVIMHDDGELNAIPTAYLSDVSYTENPEIITSIDSDEAIQILEMTDDEIIGYLASCRN